MSQMIAELRVKCIELLHKSIVIDNKIPSLQGVCDILNVLNTMPNSENEEIKKLLSTIIEQNKLSEDLALVKSKIADVL